MKSHLFVILSCGLLLLAAGCNPNPPQPEKTLKGNEAAPVWTVPDDYDFGSSMTAVIKVDLQQNFPDLATDWVLSEQDQVAAFIDNTCCGVAQQKDGLFWLYITLPASSSSLSVTLLYYSVYYTNLFAAPDAFLYENDTHLGSVQEPFVPQFTPVTPVTE